MEKIVMLLLMPAMEILVPMMLNVMWWKLEDFRVFVPWAMKVSVVKSMQMTVSEIDVKTMQHVWIKSVHMSASVQEDTQGNSVRQKFHFVLARNSVLAKMAENVLTISPTTPVNVRKASAVKIVHKISTIVLIICARMVVRAWME
jgi:hypothetical protein